MGNKCCVPNCTGNYKSSGSKVHNIFKFPKDQYLREKWLRAIHRENFQISEHCGMSSSFSRNSYFTYDILNFHCGDSCCNIKKIIHYFNTRRQTIHFVWVKEHARISGNNAVDRLAKESTKLSYVSKNNFELLDAINVGKKEMRSKWEMHWNQFDKKSNNHYKFIHPTLSTNVSHIFKYNISRKYFVLVTGIKINHAKFPAHLFRIGVSTTDKCNCDDTSTTDLNHTFFACRIYAQERANVIEEIKLKHQISINLTSLLNHVYNHLIRNILNECNSNITIFCDGSKTPKGVGSAFVIMELDITISIRVPDHSSIFTAEATAIAESLQWSIDHNVKHLAVLSDSKSILQSLASSKLTNNYLICKIKSLVYRLNQHGSKVFFVWIKGHTGILGNERADQAAKNAIHSNSASNFYVTEDLIPLHKDQMMN
nr:unnamed protein product [Callosobruchus chinensis]